MSEMRSNLLYCDFDLSENGKHVGYIRLPHSVNRSAYGYIPIPIASIRNGDGPSILLMAGNHGDEYEGQIIASKLLANIAAEDIKGQIIILPMANFPAADIGTRISPIDGLNLNRSFPGNPRGTPTEMIADFIEHHLLPHVDYMVDIHSGGSSLYYSPTAIVHRQGESLDDDPRIPMLHALGLTHTLVLGPDTAGWYASSAAYRNSVMSVTVELGGGNFANTDLIRSFEENLTNLLIFLQILQGELSRNAKTEFVSSSSNGMIYSDDEGIFEANAKPGESVQQGQVAGWLHKPKEPGMSPKTILFQDPGIVLCRRSMAPTQRGDCLYQLASSLAD